MEPEITAAITTGVLFECAKVLGHYGLKQLAKSIETQKQDKKKVSEAIERHLIEAVKWASGVQFFGMSSPQFTEQSTIALSLYTEPRRFQSPTDPTKTKTEIDLFSETNHILLLGEPGSGKTTTLKRILLTMVKEPPADERDILQFPLIIRLRELSEEDSLYEKLADIFGLIVKPYEIIVSKYIVPPPSDWPNKGERPFWEETKQTEIRIGDDKIENVIPKFLNEGQVLLLLDGLDELKTSHRAKLREEIISLGRHLTTSKIIVSCRSGDYTQVMEGFSVLEICPLNENQIIAIKDKWLGIKDTVFMERLKSLPYHDVTNRPLLLTQLLLLYKHYGYFPEQPSQVYKKLIGLLLEDWDADRGIKRISQYAGFDPRRKADFLANFSYYLTYSLQKNRFKEDDLIKAYLVICNRFRLPKEEAQQVAREIQTHTGLISIGPMDVYEFCHLSFQEYLCAEYIVRSTLVLQSAENLVKNPAPLAVAVALSSDPGSWFGNLILSLKNVEVFGEGTITSFISRVLVEGPIFEISEPLGFALLFLFKKFKNSPTVLYQLMRLFEHITVKQSIANALRWYIPKQLKATESLIEVSKSKRLIKIYREEPPLEGAFPVKLIDDLKSININIQFAEA